MNETSSIPILLIVDDEPNVVQALKRLFRKEAIAVLSASSGRQALDILQEQSVDILLTDHRMPEMSGVELLSIVKERYPDTLRMILTGYTDIDTITRCVNQGQIYKFFLKPWDDSQLILEIRQAIEYRNLLQANARLNETIRAQNAELKRMNDHLEELVEERTRELKLQNAALELARDILEEIPSPILGVSAEHLIVWMNRSGQRVQGEDSCLRLGDFVEDHFDISIPESIDRVLQDLNPLRVTWQDRTIEIIPLRGKFAGKSVILLFRGDGKT
ncbi:MAG: response regulator [Thermodesulfobacteriota bacterium]